MLEPGLQESWLDGNSTDFASGLLNTGFCAALLAGLAASGVAQHYGIPHDDALAVHALQLAQVWHASVQDLNLFRDAHMLDAEEVQQALPAQDLAGFDHVCCALAAGNRGRIC